MKLVNEEQVLDLEFRKRVIDEMIYGDENLERKLCELKKHEIYRDKNLKWLMEGFKAEGYEPTTLAEIQNRATNISVARKIVEKKAITYAGGVERVVEDATSLVSIMDLQRELDIDTAMRKCDRYRELFRNCGLYVVPVKSSRYSTPDQDKYYLCLKVLAPWQYDVIEDPYDSTKPMCVIITSFPEQYQYGYNSYLGAMGVRGRAAAYGLVGYGDQKDQVIADSPNDQDTDGSHRQFVWWTDKYHFTTNEKGVITSTPFEAEGIESVRNPIGISPFINVAQGQDGAFWAQGGGDITDGSIQINKLLTDINFIAYHQGWGQMVVTGANIPKNLTGGPNRVFKMEQKEGEPTPQVFFASSNPPLAEWLEILRSNVAMLLSTNNLSTSAITTRLDVSTAQSGVAKMIENSELVTDLQDNQQLFRDVEPMMWEVIRRWHESYSSINAFVDDLQDVKPFTDSDVTVVFNQMTPPITEKEKLEILKLKKDLGIVTTEDLILADNPGLTPEQVTKKLSMLKNKEEPEDVEEEKAEETKVVIGEEDDGEES